MNKVTCKALLTLLLIVPWGCDLDGGCGDFEQQHIDVSGLSGRNVRLLEGGYTVVEELPVESSLNFDRYGIFAIPDWQLISLTFEGRRNHRCATAYACSPPLPLPSEFISDIAVFSDTDYAQASSSRIITAGDTLNAVFNIYDYYSGRIVGLPDFLVDEELPASDQGFILQPSSRPAAAQRHTFTVHYRLTNGEFYEVTLPSVILLP